MKAKCVSIGGQAVIEGVMMRGNSVSCTAVRDPEGKIQIETERFKPVKERSVVYRIPVVRGVLNFATSMVTGMKTLMRATEVYAGEEESTKTEKWVAKKFKVDLMSIVIAISVILGILLALGLFVFLPQLIATGIFELAGWSSAGFGMSVAYNAIAGGFRMVIFILYIVAIALMKDVKRLFMYHGAEHKVIALYESGKEMTVENARGMSKEHNRCGTTFLFLVILVSILFFMLFPVDMLPDAGAALNFIVRLLVRIACIPIVAGLSYEVLKVCAKYDNIVTKIIRKPGLWLQRLTTREPDDEMLEVSLKAFQTVLEMEADPTIPDSYFKIMKNVPDALNEIRNLLPKNHKDEAELLLMKAAGVKTRTELKELGKVDSRALKEAKAVAKKRRKGVPEQYLTGIADFYGREFYVDDRVLIPRPDSERLAEETIKEINAREEKENLEILELCTGSGAVGITVSLETGLPVTATDISAPALEVAERNRDTLKAEKVTFLRGNLFAPVKKRRYDVIFANPPYIPTWDITALDKSVKDYEPHIALDGGADGLDFYRVLAASAANMLLRGGVMLLEIGAGQAEQVKLLFEKEFDIEFFKDYGGVERVVKLTKKDVAPEIIVPTIPDKLPDLDL